MKTIAIIDQQPLTRWGLNYFLKENFDHIKIIDAETYESFQELHPVILPDIFILVLAAEDAPSQINMIKNATKNSKGAEFIIYDQQPDLDKMGAIFKSGVRGYLCSQNDLSEWVKCVNMVLNGKNYLDNDIIGFLIKSLPQPSTSSSIQLTARENEIAKYIIDGLTTTCIAKLLNRKASTISTIKASIFRKMKVDNAIKLRDALTENFS